ncbi:phosphatase PAP2 family protein [Nitrogeniibacter aestuarii]|uniref:phosphatase PAP2 family protein n=1 Tax=Nitrogeniibacter aestuarii TaxID=2815343 RepID=UPI001D129B18|nr:phosphatase PAP2 family protein [Nitrogeniibacter aestuarii]
MPTHREEVALPQRPGPGALVLPLVCGISAVLVWLSDLSQPLFLAVQPLTRAVPDAFWAFVTDQAGLLSLAAWATILLMFRPAVSTAVLLACPAGLIFVRGLKHLIAADRPQQLLSSDTIHVIGRELSSLSFPSGHTAAAFTAASAALYMLPGVLRKRWAAPIIALAALVGLSRLAVGAHWPVDVLAGAAIGWCVGLTGVFAARRWPLWQRPNGMLTLAVIGMTAGIARTLLDSGYPSVEIFGRALGICAVAVAALIVADRLRGAR